MTRTFSEPPVFKIIWAVDPGVHPRLQEAAMSAIKELAKRNQATIEPVFLLDTFLTSTPTQTMGDAITLTRSTIVQKFKKVIERATLEDLKPLTILTGTFRSMRRNAAKLTDYAKLQNTDVIVLATHGRKGLKRWFLGSFAESMMQQSEIPLLIVNPHWKKTSDFRTILFPTDFSDESKDAYLKVVDFAKTSGSRIILFHKISLAITPELHLMLTHYPEYERIRDSEVADCRACAIRWSQEGKQNGVKVTVSIDDHGASSVADAVLNQQKRTEGIIALASRGKDTPPFLMGRTTRAIIQHTSSAVWVLHPTESAPARALSTKTTQSGRFKTAA